MAIRFKKNDRVKVTTGKAKGSEGRILKVLAKSSKVVVEGLNKAKKHMKPSKQNEKGGIIDREMPIHISNIMLVSSKTNEPVKVVRTRSEQGKRIRIEKKSGNPVD